MRQRAEARADTIINVVLELLEAGGYDAVQVRTVARRARVSLATLYKLFGTRDQLIIAAVERWMEANAYSELTMPEPGEAPYEMMVRVLRTVWEPWGQHPRMLEAYHRVRTSPGGEHLVMHGMAFVQPIVEAALPGIDPEYLSDLELVHSHVVRAVIARFAVGEIAVTDMLPILERTLRRLTADNRLPTASARSRASPVRTPKTATPRRTTKNGRRRPA
jgi:AcrR family transcriptional regulator